MKIIANNKIVCTNAFDVNNVRCNTVSAFGDGNCICYAFLYELNGKIGEKYPYVQFRVYMQGAELDNVMAELRGNTGERIYADVTLTTYEKYCFLCVIAYGLIEHFSPYYYLIEEQ